MWSQAAAPDNTEVNEGSDQSRSDHVYHFWAAGGRSMANSYTGSTDGGRTPSHRTPNSSQVTPLSVPNPTQSWPVKLMVKTDAIHMGPLGPMWSHHCVGEAEPAQPSFTARHHIALVVAAARRGCRGGGAAGQLQRRRPQSVCVAARDAGRLPGVESRAWPRPAGRHIRVRCRTSMMTTTRPKSVLDNPIRKLQRI
jgi:hypothetical protein